ncbi:hypothetical protein [Sporosarcina sp. A2]|uniref:hypothetical protein n=1 Tax=Sporosarcina sp. A2 TaxID=3393449 RepID=UPI003D7B7BDA
MEFHISHRPHQDSIFLDAKLVIHDGLMYWTDDWGWDPKEKASESSSWIAAKSLKWRDASNWMEKQNRYGVIDGE